MGEHLNNLVKLALVAVVGGGIYFGYLKYKEVATAEANVALEQERVAFKREEAARLKSEEAARVRAESERKAEADKRESAQREAAAREKAETDRRLAQAAEEEQRRKDAERQRADAEAAARRAVADSNADAVKRTNASTATLLEQYDTLTKEVRAAQALRDESEKWCIASKNRYDTAKRGMAENEYNSVVGRVVEGYKTSVQQLNSDQLQRNANHQRYAKEAEEAHQQLGRQSSLLKERERDYLAKKKKLDDTKRWLVEAGAIDKNDQRISSVSGETSRMKGIKRLFKKDGSAIPIQSTITMGATLRYKDTEGTWNEISTKEVDHIENADGTKTAVQAP